MLDMSLSKDMALPYLQDSYQQLVISSNITFSYLDIISIFSRELVLA